MNFHVKTNKISPKIKSVWEKANGNKLPNDGEIVIGIELSGTPLECRYNYIEKRWEAFDFYNAKWYEVTLTYWATSPV
jgi:hypothetical protein